MVASPTASSAGTKTFGKEELIEVYTQMYLIRRFEERMAQLYQQGKIGGFCHLYIGQEAVCTAAEHAITKDDYMITSYRDHGHVLVRGCDPYKVACELVMKKDGCARGKGGSMHLFDIEHNFWGGHGIVGGQTPVGTGMAFAQKYKENKGVTICFFGEAAVNQGTFHESLNMASLWDLPIIYVCENNRYGMGTSVERASAVSELSQRTACAYNVEGVAADGMDFFAMYETFSEAVHRAREESRPTFIEARTYRFRGHSMSDPGTYRTKEEVEQYREKDPIIKLAKHLQENGFASEDDINDLRSKIKNQVDDDVKRALESDDPDLSSLYEDVLV